jgi:hypothetical protein
MAADATINTTLLWRIVHLHLTLACYPSADTRANAIRTRMVIEFQGSRPPCALVLPFVSGTSCWQLRIKCYTVFPRLQK